MVYNISREVRQISTLNGLNFWGYNSVLARVSALHAECRGFESPYFHCTGRSTVGQKIVGLLTGVQLPSRTLIRVLSLMVRTGGSYPPDRGSIPLVPTLGDVVYLKYIGLHHKNFSNRVFVGDVYV